MNALHERPPLPTVTNGMGEYFLRENSRRSNSLGCLISGMQARFDGVFPEDSFIDGPEDYEDCESCWKKQPKTETDNAKKN
jgi:hypothetical protein